MSQITKQILLTTFLFSFIFTTVFAARKTYPQKYHNQPLESSQCSTTDTTSGCAVCSSSTFCKYCKSGYGYNSTTGTCTMCARAYYSMGGTSDCLPCNSYGMCSQMSEEEKKWKCPYYSFKEMSEKCEYCPKGKFTHMAQYECFKCPEHCIECDGGNRGGKCTQCESGYGMREGRSGCFKCDETKGEYSDGTTKCLSMYQSDVFLFKNGKYEYTWKDDSESTQGGNQNGTVKRENGIKGAVECNTSNKEIEIDGQCMNCTNVNPQCSECTADTANKTVTCTACYAPFVLQNGHCIPCVLNEHYEATNGGECVANKFGCNYQVGDKCVDCDSDFVLRDGECLLLGDCDIMSESTCDMCKGDIGLSTNGLCTTVKDCIFAKDEECISCQSSFIVDKNEGTTKGKCIDYENCEGNRDEYCLKSDEKTKMRVDQITGLTTLCTNADVCVTPNKENATDSNNTSITSIALRCDNTHYLKKDDVVCTDGIINKDGISTQTCKNMSQGDCIGCQSGYYMFNGECKPVDIEGCTTQIYGYCNEQKADCDSLKQKNVNMPYCMACDTDKTPYNGECMTNEQIGTTLKCSGSYNGSKCECESGYTLDVKGCVPVPTGCQTYGYEQEQCLECNKYGLFGKCYNCKNTLNETCFIIGDIDNEQTTTKRAEQDDNTNNQTPELCYAFSNTGCIRCIEGYYLTNGLCKKCQALNCLVCETESSTANCFKCEDGYILDGNKKCSRSDNITETCSTVMPSGGCAICKDGYYRSGEACNRCNESCATCVNGNECLTCAPQYFRDEISQKEETKPMLCLPYERLTNCSKKSQEGCKECDKGFYLDQTRCKPCHKNCTVCSSATECSQCSLDYIHKDKTKTTCMYFKDIPYCESASHKNGEYKCGSCKSEYQLSEDGYSCEVIPPNYALIIGASVGGGVAVIIILAIIIVLIIFAFQKLKYKKKLEMNVCTFDMKKSNIQMNILEGNVLSNKDVIDFNDEIPELEVNSIEETKELVCIGYKGKGRVKMQIVTKEDNYRFEIRTEPSLVILRQGQACEFEVFVRPLCSCSVEDTVLISALFVSTGEEKKIPMKIKFVTKMTSRLDPEELKEEKKIGEGSFGVVFLGNYRGNKVAIKKMKQAQEGNVDAEKALDEFEKEVEMLDKFRNDYIVHFYGAVFIPNKICMVTEFAQYGSLQDLIYKRNEDVRERIRVKFMLDAARGIKYLHDNNILHRDIKPDNFLVVSLERNVLVNCKLTDFGSARNVNMLMTNMTFTRGVGTPKYMAPEILNKEHYKKPADIYSFAITMLETITWQEPYPKSLYRFAWDIANAVAEGKRSPIINEVYHGGLRQIIERAWGQNPRERISIDNIVAGLEAELRKIR